MKAECPHCHGSHEVGPELIGKTVRCSGCQRDFEIVNPNLVPCPDCYTPISRRAAVCPRCGAVLRSADGTASPVEPRGEKPVAVRHPSAMNYCGAIFWGILTLPLLIGVFVLLFVFVEIRYTVYELTTRRIIIRKGWIAKTQNEIWIKDMRAVNLSQSVWQRIIGVGDIAIGTAASAGTEICIVGIASPAEVVEKINSLRRS